MYNIQTLACMKAHNQNYKWNESLTMVGKNAASGILLAQMFIDA